MSKDLEFLIEVVKEASHLINSEFEVKAKDDKGDLVTNFDYEIEKFIIDRIKKEYPTFSIISEEFNSNNTLTDNCFTVDPIDGTINFAHNIPLWGIQAACIRNKKTCAAVIYLPKLNELYYADENGAFLNDEPISVNNYGVDKGLYSTIGLEGPGIEFDDPKIKHHYRNFHSAAVSLAYVACGRLSATNCVWNTLWDYTPGEFIVERAGGIVYNESGMHIAANNEEFLSFMKKSSSANIDKKDI